MYGKLSWTWLYESYKKKEYEPIWLSSILSYAGEFYRKNRDFFLKYLFRYLVRLNMKYEYHFINAILLHSGETWTVGIEQPLLEDSAQRDVMQVISSKFSF